MNGLDNISNKIIAEAEQRAAEITEQAGRQAAETARRAEEEAAGELESGRAAIEARCADMAEKARLAATLERRRLMATTRQQLISEVFSTALERLVSLPPEQYRGLLIRLAQKALADGEGGELLFNERDRAAHGEAVVGAVGGKAAPAPVTLAADCAPIPGGLVVRRGKIELNCALDVTVRMLSDSMAFEVSGLLFPEGA